MSGGVSRKWAQTQVGVIGPLECTPTTTVRYKDINGIKVATTNVSTISKQVCAEVGAYGGYYTWEQALTACPDGWRLPTKEEWSKIMPFDDYCMWSDASDWAWSSLNGAYGANNTSGLFLPAAGCHSYASLSHTGFVGYYLSISEFSTNSAHNLLFYSSDLYQYYNNKAD